MYESWGRRIAQAAFLGAFAAFVAMSLQLFIYKNGAACLIQSAATTGSCNAVSSAAIASTLPIILSAFLLVGWYRIVTYVDLVRDFQLSLYRYFFKNDNIPFWRKLPPSWVLVFIFSIYFSIFAGALSIIVITA